VPVARLRHGSQRLCDAVLWSLSNRRLRFQQSIGMGSGVSPGDRQLAAVGMRHARPVIASDGCRSAAEIAVRAADAPPRPSLASWRLADFGYRCTLHSQFSQTVQRAASTRAGGGVVSVSIDDPGDPDKVSILQSQGPRFPT
jgi:hypothetical protein